MTNTTPIACVKIMATAFSVEGWVTVFRSRDGVTVFNSGSNTVNMGAEYNINALENKEVFDRLALAAKTELEKIEA